jgi:hypothetical protein
MAEFQEFTDTDVNLRQVSQTPSARDIPSISANNSIKIMRRAFGARILKSDLKAGSCKRYLQTNTKSAGLLVCKNVFQTAILRVCSPVHSEPPIAQRRFQEIDGSAVNGRHQNKGNCFRRDG